MSEKPIYTTEYDETIPTNDRDGVVEHKHTGFEYWHPICRMHEGCGRTECGIDRDVRMCAGCVNADDISLCHTRRRQLGMRVRYVAHGVKPNERITHSGNDYSGNHTRTVGGVLEHRHPEHDYWHVADTWHTYSIDRADTLLMIDEAVAELSVAKSVLVRVGIDSDHVQQAKCEQLTMNIDDIVGMLLKMSRCTEEKMEAERNGIIQ